MICHGLGHCIHGIDNLPDVTEKVHSNAQGEAQGTPSLKTKGETLSPPNLLFVKCL